MPLVLILKRDEAELLGTICPKGPYLESVILYDSCWGTTNEEERRWSLSDNVPVVPTHSIPQGEISTQLGRRTRMK
eukprot:scaffold710_cov171-Amphora_coffeaeformis.AAC.57